MQISTNGTNMLPSNYFKDFIQSENNNTNLKTSKVQENINYNINNINNGNNTTTNQMKVNQQDKKITQNKIISQGIKNNELNNLKALDSSKGTISSRNFTGKKFIFSEKSEKNDEMKNSNNNEEKVNNLNRFTKIGKDPKMSTKQSDKVKNIFSSKIADN